MPESLNYLPTQKEWQILTQHAFRCEMCQFQSKSSDDVPAAYLEVILWQQRPHVLCAFCASSLRLTRSVGGSNQHGSIVFAPHLSQANLCDIARLCGIASLAQWDANTTKAAHYVLQRATRLQIQPADFPWIEKEGDIHSFAAALSLTRNLPDTQTNPFFAHFKYLPDPEYYVSINRYYLDINPDYFSLVKH